MTHLEKVGFGDITPISNYEKLFTIMTMITGVSIYATIFGNMGAQIIFQIQSVITTFNDAYVSLKDS